MTPSTISLVVVTYQREARLLEQLAALRPHRALFHEVIVVDNGASNGLEAQACAAFGSDVTVLRPDRNLGAVARSMGILASTGDLVVTLDDDVRLLAPRQLETLRAFFASHERAGCANFKIFYDDGVTLDLSDWCHPRDPVQFADQAFESSYISEGACALHGPAARALGAYALDLFIGQEGVELAARLLDRGYGIYYVPSVAVAHGVASEGRAAGRQFYFNARNIYWIAVRRFPPGFALRTLAREWSTLLLFAVVRGGVVPFLRGCWDGLRRTPALLREREPIRTTTVQHIRQLNRGKPSVWRRLRRVARSQTLN